MIARAGIGTDNIDVVEAERRGIKVVTTPNASTEAVAELTVTFMLMLLRRVNLAIELAKKGKWEKVEGAEINGKTVGIIGYGRIGKRVAEILRGFNANIIVYDISPVPHNDKQIQVSRNLDELLERSDIVTLHVPLTKETYHLINEQRIERMKEGAILINTSRGAVVDTRALLAAIKKGKISAAALDVLENEPPKEQWEFELLNHPNVIVTPHIGAQTKEAQEKIAVELVGKIMRELAGGAKHD